MKSRTTERAPAPREPLGRREQREQPAKLAATSEPSTPEDELAGDEDVDTLAQRPGRKPTKVRLPDLDPVELSREFAAAVAAHAAAVNSVVSLHTRREAPNAMRLALDWVRTGAPPEGAKAFQDIARALYGRAPDQDETGLLGCHRCKAVLVDPTTALGTMILAGEGRRRVSRGEPATVLQIAALANLSRQAIWKRTAGVTRSSREIPASRAREILIGASVPGIA